MNRSKPSLRFIRRTAALALALLVLTACGGAPAIQETPAAVAPAETQPAAAEPASSAIPTEALVLPETAGTEASEPPAGQSAPAQLPAAQTEPPGQACISPAAPSPAMTEGPYYKAGSPERISLVEEGMGGTRLILTGRVLTTGCQPVANAWLDFWQTDAEGAYDNAGYRMRGHQFADEEGRYRLETVVPGLYTGRTAHIHVKVQAPDGDVLTTQLFMPEEPGNLTDSIFSQDMVIIVQEVEDSLLGEFNFILDLP